MGLSLSQTRKKLGFWVTNGVLRETSQDIFEVREDVNNSVSSLHFSQHHNLHLTTPALVMGMFDFARNITRLLISDSIGRRKEKIIINIITNIKKTYLHYIQGVLRLPNSGADGQCNG